MSYHVCNNVALFSPNPPPQTLGGKLYHDPHFTDAEGPERLKCLSRFTSGAWTLVSDSPPILPVLLSQFCRSQSPRTDQVPRRPRAHNAQGDTPLFRRVWRNPHFSCSRVLPSLRPSVRLPPFWCGRDSQTKWEEEPEVTNAISFYYYYYYYF